MKKFLSMFMSIVMLLSITAGMNITANAEDNGAKTIASATLTPVKPYEIYEGAYGGYDDEGNGYYWSPDFNHGDEIDIVFTDGTKDTFTYSYDGFRNANYGSLYISACSFYSDGLGEATACYEIYGCDDYEISNNYEVSATVNIVENPVDSFTFSPAKQYEIIENSHGYSCDEGWNYYAPGDYEGGRDGDVITIKYTDGTTEEFTCIEEGLFYNDKGEILSVRSLGFVFNGTGETTFKVTLPDYGKSVDVPVTIIENPVESFKFSPAKPYEIIENTHGYSNVEGYFEYDSPHLNNGDVITVKYTNGNTDTFIYDGWDFYNKYDEYLRVYRHDFTFTGLGETTFVVELEDYGKSIDVPVTIIENPVESFTFLPAKPYEIMEDTSGWYDEEENWYYYLEDFNYGDQIIVNYKEGYEDTFEYKGFTGDYVFYNEKNDGLNVSKYGFYYDGVGETSFKVELEDYYKSVHVPVKITENPVESFTLKPVKPYEIVENTNRWFDEEGSGWYYKSPDFNNGDEITVNYTNGTKDTFTFTNGKFINESGKVLPNVEGSLFTFDGLGETTFEVELFDYNKSIEVPVKIVAASNPGGGSTGGGSTGGGSIGGGGGGGFVPAPTPEEPATTEPTTQPSTKPSAPATTTTKKPSTVKVEKVTKGTKSFKVTWKKKTGVSGYQVQYATDKKFKKNKKTVTIAKKNATSKTVKKLKAKKTYYVRVRTYKIVNGKKVYSSWSKVKAVKTK